jgi:hypothetical protein
MHLIQTLRPLIATALCLWTLLFSSFAVLAQETSQKKEPVAEVVSPKDGARVPRNDEDPPCPEQGPCTKINVDGRVAQGWPFIAVSPVLAAPKVWIQPPVVAMKSNGAFSGMAYLGTERHGIGEKYNLFIIACKDKDRFQEGEVLMGLPQDCVVSESVTVLRTK